MTSKLQDYVALSCETLGGRVRRVHMHPAPVPVRVTPPSAPHAPEVAYYATLSDWCLLIGRPLTDADVEVLHRLLVATEYPVGRVYYATDVYIRMYDTRALELVVGVPIFLDEPE